MAPTPASRLFVVDAETDGLYGEVWAIGAIVLDNTGAEIATFAGQTDPQDVTDSWVRDNVVPKCDLPRYPSRRDLRDAFWSFWLSHRGDVLAVADCGYPVETGLFRACVADHQAERQWLGPYPLHDVATHLLAAGIETKSDRFRLAGMDPKHNHDPLQDARASGVCWLLAASTIQAFSKS